MKNKIHVEETMRSDEIDWLGVLATDEEIKNSDFGKDNCFVNKSKQLQFYLKVISSMPNRQKETPYVTCYSDKLDDKKIVDNQAWDEMVRSKDYTDQLKHYFFKFNYEENGRGYFRAKNIEVTKISKENYEGENFTTIPMVKNSDFTFEEENPYPTYEALISALKNGAYISKLKKYNTDDSKNIPYMVFYDVKTLECHVLGNFTDSVYDDTKGILYHYEQLKSFSFEKEWYEDVVTFESNPSIMFIRNEVHEKIMEALKQADVLDEKENDREVFEDVSLTVETDDEWKFIEHFEAVAKNDGLFYAKKDLINFHTAVKSNSLVILSGLSGTGKSRLVQCYAKALGIQEDTFHMIPVRPNWNDDSDLIGFVDSMHMVYRPADCGFTNILMEASQKENADKLYLICFDEMNLARVEHYFSQFLSILEMPKESKNLRLYASEYESRLYNADKYPSVVNIGNNIRFIGTVNIDESTFHFSDKVLDRANVIKLDIIPYTQWRSEKVNTEEMSMTYTTYKGYVRKPKDDVLTEREREFIWKVHELINACDKNLGVGPRILKQIGTYLVNLPQMEGKENISRKEGFDLQFVQRIVTKIRGQKEQLDPILNVKSECGLEKLFDAYADVSDFEKSRKVLETKQQEINNYGYTL